MATLWSLPFGIRIVHASIGANELRYLATVTLYILLSVALLACTATDRDSANDERLSELGATVQCLQESLQAIQN